MYPFLIFMSDKITYSLKQRYLSVDDEKRINRRQFFTRIFIPWILFIPCAFFLGVFVMIPIGYMLVQYWITPIIVSVMMMPVYMLIYVCLFLIFLPKLIIKRSRDFWSSGTIESRLFLWLYLIFFTIAIILIGQILSLKDGPILGLEVLLMVREVVRYGIILLLLYLLFRPGNQWDNEYGQSPKNTKIGFLG